MIVQELKIGSKYNFKSQPERLIYMGATKYHGDPRDWHQFALTSKPDTPWSEITVHDMWMIEPTKGEAP